MNIFANDKNQKLAKLIQDNKGDSYKVVDTYFKENPVFFKKYCAFRKTKEMPFAKRNALIWELVNMIHAPEDGDDFEA